MIEANKLPDLIKFSDKHNKDVAYHNDLSFQITGDSESSQVQIIKGFEPKHIKDIREYYSTPINWLWEWILAPVNKIFTANGGSINIEDTNEDSKTNLIKECANLKTGISLRNWMEKYWLENYLTNPAGIILMEYDFEKTWPVFYGIKEIINYKLTGKYVDWVIFQPFKAKVAGKEQDVYRVYDETGDRSFIRVGKDFKEIDSYVDKEGNEKQGYYSLPEQFTKINGGKVPAFIIGDNPDNTKKKTVLSFIDKQIRLGKEYYNLDTIRIFTAIKNGYGTYYWYTKPCKRCNGIGWLGSEEDHEDCPICKGAGRIYPRNVNDIYLIDIESEDKLPGVPGGIINGDVTGWQQYVEQLKVKGKDIELSHWGTQRTDQSENNTATGSFIDSQSVNDKCNQYLSSAENCESTIFRYIGAYNSTTFIKGYITYGRRLQIENPDTLWNKYLAAKEKGAPQFIQLRILIEYIESSYRYDNQTRERLLKLLAIEPFPLMTIEEVKALEIGDELKSMKSFFVDWSNQKLDSDILNSTNEKLLSDLREFNKLKTNEYGKKEQSSGLGDEIQRNGSAGGRTGIPEGED